ncbi:MAG: BON domain-containing protein [Pseudonocardia sp.]|nr:BON domain-containing protein [Pseudonocardia sp.]
MVTLTGELDTRADTRLLVEFTERLEGVVAVTDQLSCQIDQDGGYPTFGPLY